MTSTLPQPDAEGSVEQLSRDSRGRLVPSAYARLTPPEETDRLAGWLVTLGVATLALVMRLFGLGTPHDFLFDETYYAKDARSLWEFGYARNWPETADSAILDGRYAPTLMEKNPALTVHPEVGKWLIGLGQEIFGFDPVGWRVASVVVGVAMVAVLVRMVRRLTRSTLLGGLAGLLMCFDGLHFTLSRLALLDIFVAFFLLGAVACLVADRDYGRVRLARLAQSRSAAATGSTPPGVASGWGPVRGVRWRPWRLAAGVLFGLAIACKWTALAPLAGFGLLVVAWDIGARRSLGVRGAWWRGALLDGIPAFGYLVLVAFAVYVATWSGWLLHADAVEAGLARNNYGDYWGAYTQQDRTGFVDSLVDGLRSLYYYHRDVYAFHSGGLVGSTHPYQSHPGSWIAMYRPVSVAVENGIQPGEQGCLAPAGSTCLREIVMLGTPALWWGGIAALLYAPWGWLRHRDWRFGLALVGVATTWLPFFRYADRPIFSFYAIALLPFTIVAICLLAGRVLGNGACTKAVKGSGRSSGANSQRTRRFAGSVAVGTFVVLVVAHFAWLWPVYTYDVLTNAQWLDRLWFRSWI